MAMQSPPHPGGIVKRQCLEPLDLSITRAARGLGVTRQALSELVNERAGVSVDMAIRLSEGVRFDPRDLARHADGLRFVAGTGTCPPNQGREFSLRSEGKTQVRIRARKSPVSSVALGIARLAVPEVPLAQRARSVSRLRRPSRSIPRGVPPPTSSTATASSPTSSTNPPASLMRLILRP